MGNPQEQPKHAGTGDALSPMIMVWSVAVVFGSAALGGLAGLGIGAALGQAVPGYYRSVFPNGTDQHFDPIAVGIGQGLTQGVVFGAFVGMFLVGVYYWRNRSSQKASR
jgi:hypothetical protein